MVSAIIKKTLTGVLKDKTEADTLLEEAGKKIKSAETGDVKLTPRKNLLKKEKKDKKVKIDGEELVVKQDEQTATQVKVENKKIKVKEKDKVADDVLEEISLQPKSKKIYEGILRDFNIDKIESAEDIKNLIQKISLKFKDDIEFRKRGTQKQETTKALATLLRKNENDLASKLLTLERGSTLNAETIFAARELLVASLNKLNDLAIKAERGGVADVVAFRQHFALTAELQKVIKGVQTETARALQQFRIKTRETGPTNIRLDELREDELLVTLGGEGSSRTLAKLYLDAQTSSKKLAFNQQTGAFANIQKAADSITESFLNVILSNPMTHVRNTAGNWLSQAIVQLERKMATNMYAGGKGIPMAEFQDVAAAFGKHQVALEMHAAIKTSLAKVIKEGKFEAADIKPLFKGNKLDADLKPNAASAANFNIENKKVAGVFDFAGKFITLNRVPTRFLTFADNYFKNIEYRGILYEQAFKEAMFNVANGRLDIKQASDYIADYVINPTKQATDKAFEGAKYVTFQTNKRGDWLDYVNKAGSTVKEQSGWFKWWTNYYLPFVRTPTNIAGFALERTPVLQFTLRKFREDLAAGGEQRQVALAKMALGHTFFMAVSPLGYFGITNGTDPLVNKANKRDIQKLQGDIAKSFKLPLKDMGIGDTNYNIGTVGLDPFSQMLGQASDLGALAHYVADNPKNWRSYSDFTLGMILSFGENLSNSTYMQGFSNLSEDITYAKRAWKNDGDDKFVKRYFSRWGASFVPTFVRQGGKFFNDNQANISKEFNELILQTVKDNVKTTSYTITGKPVIEINFINKYRDDDPIDAEIKRVNPKLPKYNNYFTYKDAGKIHTVFPQSVEMTSEEQSMYQELSGKLAVKGGFEANNILKTLSGNKLADGFEKMFKSDYYKNANPILQEKFIAATVSASRSKAKEILSKQPIIAERILNKGRDKLAIDVETKQTNLMSE